MAIGSLLVTELQGETIYRVSSLKVLSGSLSILYDDRQKLASRFQLIVRLFSNTGPREIMTLIFYPGDKKITPGLLVKHTAERLKETIRVIKTAEEQLNICCASTAVTIQVELADQTPFMVTENVVRKNVRGWFKVLRGLEKPV